MPKKSSKESPKQSEGGEKKPHWGHGRKGPRAQVWKGSLSFGLVSVPVALVSASRGHDFRFRQLHRPDHAPIEQRRYCSLEEIEVGWDEVGRGYELDEDQGGGIVVLTDEELDSVAPERTETIEIEAFIDEAEVDPIQFNRPYHVALTGTSDGDRRAYRLLLEAMERAGRAAIGRMVMRSREYLVLVRPHGGILGLTTLHFHDEVRPVDDIPAGEGAKPPAQALRTAIAVIEELSADWEPADYRDHFRENVAAILKERRRDRPRVSAVSKVREKASAQTDAPDLMAALSRALDEAQGRGSSARGTRSSKRRSSSRRNSLDEMSRDDLYRLAKETGLPGRSRMTKEELRKALESRR